MITKIRRLIEEALVGRYIKLNGCDGSSYSMNISSMNFVFENLDRTKCGLYVKGDEEGSGKEVEIKLIEYSLLASNINELKYLIKTIPLFKVINSYPIRIDGKDYVENVLSLFPYDEKASSISLHKYTLLDTDGVFFKELQEKRKNSVITKTEYLEYYKKYAFKAYFKRTDFEVIYMYYKGVNNYLSNSYSKRYIINNQVIPYVHYSEDENIIEKDLGKIGLKPLNFKMVINKTQDIQNIRLLSTPYFLPDKHKILSQDKGLYIFQNSVEEDVINSIYNEVDKDIDIALFSFDIVEGVYKLLNNRVKLNQILLNDEKSSDVLYLFNRCVSNTDAFNCVIIPSTIDIDVETVIRLSNYTKVYWLNNYGTIYDFLFRLDSSNRDRLLSVLKGVGDISKEEYLDKSIIRELYQHIDYMLNKISNKNHILLEQHSQENSCIIGKVNYKDLFDNILTRIKLNQGDKLVIDDNIYILNGTNGVIQSNIRFKYNKEIMTRIILELIEDFKMFQILKEVGIIKIIYESKSTNNSYTIEIIKNNFYKNGYKFTIVPVVKSSNSEVNQKGITLITTPDRDLKINRMLDRINTIKNSNIFLIDINNDIPNSIFDTSNQILRCGLDDLKTLELKLKLAQYDVLICSSIDDLDNNIFNTILSKIDMNKTFIISSKYYLPEFVEKYLNDVNTFIRYTKEIDALIRDGENIILDKLDMQSARIKMDLSTKDTLKSSISDYYVKVCNSSNITDSDIINILS